MIVNTKVENDTIAYGKSLTKVSIFSILVNQFDKIIIGFFDIELLAAYLIAIKLIDVVKKGVKSFYVVSFPKFAKFQIFIGKRKVAMLMLLGLVVSIVLCFISPPVIDFLYSNKYSESAHLFVRLVFIFPFVFVAPLFANKARARQDVKKIIGIRVVVPFISIVLSVFVLISTNNLEYFVLTKIYVLQIGRFIALNPFSLKL